MGAPLLVVTPWYPVAGAGSPLEAAVAAGVDVAARAGADVTVVHLVPRQDMDGADDADEAAPGTAPVTVRRIVVEASMTPGDPGALDAIAAALAHDAADLLGNAAVVHAHAAVPVAAAVARVAPESARLVVGEHLASALPLLGTPDADDARSAAWQAVLDRADVVLAPSEHLVRLLGRHLDRQLDIAGRDGQPAAPRRPRFELLPYPGVRSGLRPSGAVPTSSAGAGSDDALPATRWLLLGPPTSGEPLVRALAADVLAGAASTLTVVADEGLEALTALAARLGVERRLVRVAPEDALALFTGTPAVDLVVGPDPLAAADPLLTTAFAAGVPAVLARAPGSEDLVDEVAGTGAVRIVRPAADVVTLLEAVADLRLAEVAAVEPGDVRAPHPPFPATLLAPWRSSPDGAARLLARCYGEAVVPPPGGTTRRPWPRVLLVDLVGGHRQDIARLATWITGIGGEPVVVTASAPPPSSALPGAVTVDLRGLQRTLARPPLARVRRRLPRPVRPVLDRAYRTVRPAPTLVTAALAGPLAPGGARPSADVDVVVAGDDESAELARRWSGATTVLPPGTDQLIAHLTAVSVVPPAPSVPSAPPATVAAAATTSSAGSEGS